MDQNTSIQPLHHEADQKRHEREGGYKVTGSSELHAQEDSPSPTVTRQRRYARYHLSQRRLTPQESQYSSAARTRRERTLVWIEILCGRGEGWILLKIPRCDIDGVREVCVGWSERENRWLVSKRPRCDTNGGSETEVNVEKCETNMKFGTLAPKKAKWGSISKHHRPRLNNVQGRLGAFEQNDPLDVLFAAPRVRQRTHGLGDAGDQVVAKDWVCV